MSESSRESGQSAPAEVAEPLPRTEKGRLRLRARSRLFRKSLQDTDYVVLVGLSVVVGLAAGGGAIGVRFLIAGFTTLFYGRGEGPLALAPLLPFWRVLLAPAIGGLVIGPIIWYSAREARGHGVPEVMAAVLLRQSRIRARVAWIKAFVSSLCIGSGGSAGREGPMAQVGSALGSALGQRLGLSERAPRTLSQQERLGVLLRRSTHLWVEPCSPWK